MDYQTFYIKKEALKLKGVKQFRHKIDENLRIDFIKDIYLTFEKSQVMIFMNKKTDAQTLQKRLKEDTGTNAEILIGGIDQAKRDQIIDDFRKTTITTLICTNVLARGIDVPEVDLVINYDVPYLSKMGFLEPDYANY